MSEFEPNKSGQHLKDVLYELQSARERADAETEPAFIDDGELTTFEEACSIFVDYNTDDRIVLTPLPLDEEEFSGAFVWLSNPHGVEIEELDAKPSEIIFWVDKGVRVRAKVPSEESPMEWEGEALAERLTIPRVLPLPQWEEDPRPTPSNVETLFVPQTDAYTKASAIIDKELKKGFLIVKRSGITEGLHQTSRPLSFRLRITEEVPDNEADNTSDDDFELEENRMDAFDRQFKIEAHFSSELVVPVMPWGKTDMYNLKTNRLRVKVMRQGALIQSMRYSLKYDCVPTPLAAKFISQLLDSADAYDFS